MRELVHEEPRIFFLHYWGVGPAEKLARTLKAAIAETGKDQPKENSASIIPAEVLCR